MSIVLSKEFVYPVAAVVSTFYLIAWQTVKVSGARKRAQVPYPYLYAEKADASARKEAMVFNCTQRAHQNTLEVYPVIVAATLIGGLQYPVVSAGLCGAWVMNRILYTVGYSTGDPAKRISRIGSLFGLAGLGGSLVTATVSVATLLKQVL
ncbi:membrane-associated proteins in eicosanoid and glutathione metabolism [Epithele typhae]|uniref:membrane-associated proteins in eicosanoid and glutathione metabolism n=1 Tax=Epithele typhae TaxID=378194 RepID=UPI0020077D7A|nr:membrane-associated proteins in eicosanoid and glutathione metabolism [Epithele typhae]KAH9913321.1 membrane-associated proteins in eicosanoid and glutathione metabolism [Epithele typhae]